MFDSVTGFAWGEGNLFENWEKHEVSTSECEEVLFNQPLVVKGDGGHSDAGVRFLALGRTNSARELFMVFTVRASLIRVISARETTKEEREAYSKP